MKKSTKKTNLKKKYEKLMKNKTFKKYFVISLVAILAIVVISIFVSFSSYNKAASDVKEYLESSDTVTVKKTNSGYYFDGPGKDSAIIFYPGGKVESKAYAPLLFQLADSGVDCFLLDVRFKLAIFDKNKADKVLNDNYKYTNWYLAGHSLGGVVASKYANKNDTRVAGLILLASYPNEKVGNNIKMLSIYGSEDGALNMKKYSEAKKYYIINNNEIVIIGVNHSQFGNYGLQKGDNEAMIPRREQQATTVDSILKFINE